MPGWSIHARAARGTARKDTLQRDPDVLAAFLEDAAHFPGGHAESLIVATSEADVAQAVTGSTPVLPIGAQSSLTGGATPMGETLVTTSRLNHILEIGADTVRVEAGVTLADLDAALRNVGRYYPPTPTFMGAFVGGTIATNAAGAATFKYGTTRDWVRALTVVLPDGGVLDIERGAVVAHADGYFEIAMTDRVARVPVPRYRPPKVAKLAAGYFAATNMDLIDLFIGSEGTLGIVTEATLRVMPTRPAMCLVFVPFSARIGALAFVRQLRGLARDTWRTKDPMGIDVSAIEHMDARCLELLREDGIDRAEGVHIPAAAEMALLVTLELPPGTTGEQAYEEIGGARDASGHDGPLRRFCRLLDAAGVLDALVDHPLRAGESAAGRARGSAGGGQQARRPREADDRRARRENGSGHDRALRSPRRADDHLRDRLRHPRSRRRDLGPHLGRQPASERHSTSERRCRSRQNGDSRVRARGDPDGRRAARRARRRTEPGQAAAARAAVRQERHQRHARREARDRSRVEAGAGRAVLTGLAHPFDTNLYIVYKSVFRCPKTNIAGRWTRRFVNTRSCP